MKKLIAIVGLGGLLYWFNQSSTPKLDKRQYLIDKYVNTNVQGTEMLSDVLPKMTNPEVDFLYQNEDVLFKTVNQNWSDPIVQKAIAIFKKYVPNLDTIQF